MLAQAGEELVVQVVGGRVVGGADCGWGRGWKRDWL